MVQRVDNEFTEFQFQEDELPLVYVLTDLQEMGMRTSLAQVTREKLDIKPDPKCPEAFQIQHAYNQGRMDILRGILLTSTQIKERMEERLQAEIRNQPQFSNHRSE